MIVDDDKEILDLLGDILESLNVHVVESAHSGKDALEFLQLQPEQVDAIISDWNMPDLNGMELYKESRNLGLALPFILLTARRDMDSVLQAKKHGIKLYVTKPFSRDEIKRKIDILIKEIL